MTHLRELLDDLATSGVAGADQAGVPEPAASIWQRGHQLARARRAAAGAAVVAFALAAVLTGVNVVDPSPVPPADADQTVRLPTQLYAPSRWLPGTAGHPIGPLAALATAPRGRSGWGYVGVSGVTGEYRFLDLPDAAKPGSARSPALSPDGRYVAYWLAGQPDGAPHSHEDDILVGVAVYDTVTGNVQRHRLATEHGRAPWGLVWLDEDRLYVLAGQHVGAAGTENSFRSVLASGDWGMVWTISTDARQPVDGSEMDGDPGPQPLAVNGQIVFRDLHDVVVVDPSVRPARVLGRTRLPGRTSQVVLSPSFHSGAVVLQYPLASIGVFIDDGSRADPLVQPVPGLGPARGGITVLHAMPDDEHLVLTAPFGSGPGRQVLRVNVRTGQQQVLTTYPPDPQYGDLVFALDALARDPVPRPAPPQPWDPLVAWGLVVGAATLGVLALVRWRRRVRP